jgi:uncharacterized membrane protein
MTRFPLPDLLKGFAAVFLIQVHIMTLFIDLPGRESLIGKISFFVGGPFAAMLFMIIMGYFIAKSSKSVLKNILRGVKIFALGFLLNIGLNFNLLLKIKFAGWQFNPLEYIFGVDILYLAGLSLIIIAFLRMIKKGQIFIATAMVFIIIGLTGFMNKTLTLSEPNYILPFIAGTYSWSYFPLFPWLAYPLIGYAFFHWEEKLMLFFKNQKAISAIILTGILLLVLRFFPYGFSIKINLPLYYHHTFWFALWAIGIVILWVVFLRFLLHKFPNTLMGDFLQWLGKNITLFYVIQWLIIGNIATAIYQTQSINSYWYWFGGIFTITVALTWLLEKANIKLAR